VPFSDCEMVIGPDHIVSFSHSLPSTAKTTCRRLISGSLTTLGRRRRSIVAGVLTPDRPPGLPRPPTSPYPAITSTSVRNRAILAVNLLMTERNDLPESQCHAKIHVHRGTVSLSGIGTHWFRWAGSFAVGSSGRWLWTIRCCVSPERPYPGNRDGGTKANFRYQPSTPCLCHAPESRADACQIDWYPNTIRRQQCQHQHSRH
jgi:hypothetical protein